MASILCRKKPRFFLSWLVYHRMLFVIWVKLKTYYNIHNLTSQFTEKVIVSPINWEYKILESNRVSSLLLDITIVNETKLANFCSLAKYSLLITNSCLTVYHVVLVSF